MKYRDENGQWQDILLPATGDTYPIGSMAPFAGIVVPTNWLKCDGSQYNKSDYPELYKVIGDTWNLEGDNDDTKFRVPDMSERAAIGATNEFPVGTLLGEKEVQLTIDELPSHSHRYERVEGATNFGGYFGGAAMSADGTLNTTGNGTANTGGNEPHNNIPPSAATMYIIKAKNSAGFLGVVTEDISDENENAVANAKTTKEYIDNFQEYSEEENVVGTWLGKPLYRKVLTGTLPTGAGENVFDIPNTVIRNHKGLINSKYHSWYPINGELKQEAGYEIYSFLNQGRNQLKVRCGDFYTTSSSYEITIEYTKTTD